MESTGFGDIDYLGYVDNPDWSLAHGDWRSHISEELRGRWHTFTYEQKWFIAQNTANLANCVAQAMRWQFENR